VLQRGTVTAGYCIFSPGKGGGGGGRKSSIGKRIFGAPHSSISS